MTRRIPFLIPAAFAIAVGFSGCDGGRPVREAPLPPSQRETPLSRFQPTDALEHLEEWHPGDWRFHLLRALVDTSWQRKVAGLRTADSLFPGEPLIAYHLCLAFLEREDPEEERLARPYLESALALDPENGVLRVMDAYLLLREDRLGEARALFSDPRRLPRGDFHYPRLEETVLGLFSHAGYLNPSTLIEAVELYRRIPLPPFEKWVGVLYAVFLSPLSEHPYDIRIRGKEAAEGLFRLGRALRVGSYSGPEVLSDGYEQRALGFMFQLKAAEFLTHFHRTFEDSSGADEAFRALVEAQREYQSFMESQPWQDAAVGEYLDNWTRLVAEHPRTTVSRAVEEAREWTLWKKTMRFRYPRRDDPG